MVAARAKVLVGYTVSYLDISVTTMPKGPQIESRPADVTTCKKFMSVALYRCNLPKTYPKMIVNLKIYVYIENNKSLYYKKAYIIKHLL